MSAIASVSSRQIEILDMLLHHGLDYMRQLLTIGKTDQPEIPSSEILRSILTDWGPVYVKLGQCQLPLSRYIASP
jgi:ubiquinone biosynthesis protein